jgi:dTDP-4-amino-4,6-dideoxygalactose transaminase
MYDAAHAFGCSHKGRMIGGFGRCEVFSFQATKFFNSFEGGAVVTDDDMLAQKMRLMRNFGFAGSDHVIYVGTNGKMTEICAAMGLTSLDAIDEFVAVNRRNYECYRDYLKDLPGTGIIRYNLHEKGNYQYIVVDVDPNTAPLNRDELVATLQAENVLARKYFWPGCHRMEPYRSYFPNAGMLLPNTERVASRIILLPTGQSVKAEDIESVCEIVRRAFDLSGSVRAKLGQGQRIEAVPVVK